MSSKSLKRKFEDDEEFVTPSKKINPNLRSFHLSDHGNSDFLTDDEDEISGRCGMVGDDDDLKSKLNILTNKLDICQSKFRKAEEENSNKLKHLETTLNCKIAEKDKLIVNLQLFIDEQEARHKRVLDARGGEDAEVSFNYTNPLHRFASEVKSLQAEKYHLMDKNSQLEIGMKEMKNKYSNLEATMRNEYILLSEYNILEEEVKMLRQSRMDCKKVLEKENMEPDVSESTRQSESAKKMVKDLRNEINMREKEHFDNVTKLRVENHSIRKKLSESLNNYTNLAFTPPKTIVKEVTDTKMEKKLEELKSERIELQWELKSVKRELQKTSEESVSIIAQNKEHKEKEMQLQEELKATKEVVQEIRNQLKESNVNYSAQIAKIEKELLSAQEQSEIREKSAKLQFDAEINKLNLHSRARTNIADNVSEQLKKLLLCLKGFRTFQADIETQVREMKAFYCCSLNSFKQSLQSVLEKTEEESSSLLQNYRKEIQLRKKLHNKLVELKGNIRVFCRVRPLIREDGEGSSNVITFNSMDDSLIFVEHKLSKKKFEVDKVFPPNVLQTEVFAEVKSLVESCLDGYNVCIFAYGQTGSGKTYTMEGTLDHPGINQQALHLLFDKSAQLNDWDHTIQVSFIEIYNETLIDLLNEEPNKLAIKQGKDGVHVPGLTRIEVNELADVNQIFSLGHRNRTVASTSMNERSSRSHSVLTITVTGINVRTGMQTAAKLNLVDLAGSERVSKSGSEGLRMKEAQNINKSLSALGDVIYALKNKNQHIPYRNSKLTYLLQESLSGDAKTLMMVQVSPAAHNSSETFCSLDFAQRVRSVELGKATCSTPAKN